MTTTPETIRDAITNNLAADEATREPMNALIVWTELGKGLCGTLDRKGADLGLLGRIIEQWCAERGAVDVDLAGWAYRVDPEKRLSQDALASALQRLQTSVERALTPVADAAGEDGGRTAFLIAVKGWFPAGLAVFRALPAAAGATEAQLLGALRAWCHRYFPKDPAGPADLGVRMTRD